MNTLINIEIILNNKKMAKKILIAEDDATNYQVLLHTLDEDNAEILWAQNGQQAVDMFIANPDIDVILMDVRMPVMNGILATDKIKEINPNIPIIAVTASDKDRVGENKFDEILQKPFPRDTNLIEIIDGHIIEKVGGYIKNLFEEMMERDDVRQKKWVESEQETLQVLEGVTEILNLNDKLNMKGSEEILKKLNKIQDIVEQRKNK